MAFINDVINGALAPTNLRDYQHASKTFVANNYQNSPKFKNWFHINFELNSEAKKLVDAAVGATKLPWKGELSDLATLGVLVKSVSLPNFKFDVKKHNQYNKKTLNVTRINYDPVSIEFHDDTASQMRAFWYAYYQYYIQDPRFSGLSTTKLPEQYNNYASSYSNIYNTADKDYSYGMDTVAKTGKDFNRPEAFFKDIRIYHFSRNHDKKGAHFQEYVLVNPVLSNFSHDTLAHSDAGQAKGSMSIEYETVLYNSGIIGKDQIATWTEVQKRYWDGKKSPLSSGQANILGTGGLLETGESILGGLTSGNPLQILGAVITGAKAVNTVKAAGGLGKIAKAELNGIIATNLTGLQNGSKSISVPGLDRIPGLGNAVGSANGLLNNILTPPPRGGGG